MNKQNQNGSAFVVIIIILIVAIVGALSLVFWQNFIQKEPHNASSNISEIPKKDDVKTKAPQIKVEENEYSFNVAEGFEETSEQMFIYTGSLKPIKSYVNKEGDYFEVLKHYGGGGGISGDYFWNYDIKDGKVVLNKKPRCTDDNSFCLANNESIEGIISNSPEAYYFSFGNKNKNDISLEYVDEFISTFEFK